MAQLLPSKTRPLSLGELCRLERDLPVLQATMAWIRDYLACPHAELGRPGVVCPFVPRALALSQIYLSVSPSKNADEIESTLLDYRDQFLAMESDVEELADSSRDYRAIVTILPDLELDVLQSIQSRLKTRFVDVGLMVGEFHPDHRGPALHNSNFRPLVSPFPMLGIRRIVESDLVFLTRAGDPASLRVQFLRSFLRALGPSLTASKAEEARLALLSAEAEVEEP